MHNLHVLADLKTFFPYKSNERPPRKNLFALCLSIYVQVLLNSNTLKAIYIKTIVIIFSTIIIIFLLVLANSVLARIPAASKFALECLLAAGIISTARLSYLQEQAIKQYF